MPEPHMNSVCCVGKMLRDGKMDYVGPNNAIPRCRFTLIQARPHKLERDHAGYETVMIPCEIHGRYAESFVRIAGQDSWVSIEGRIRSYSMKGKYPQLRIAVRSFSLWKAVRPNRGYETTHVDHNESSATGMPVDGDEDGT